MEELTTYFAYGSNMNRPRLGARVETVRAIGVAALPDMQLIFNKPGRDGSGKANVIRCAGRHVWGVIYSLSPDGLRVLDPYEPGYTRELHQVRGGDGLWTEAYLYRWPGEQPAIPAARWYLTLLVEGAREHGLPEDYRRGLEALLVNAQSRRDEP